MERKLSRALTTSPSLVCSKNKKKKTLSETLGKPPTGEVALSEVMGHEQGHVSQWRGSEKVRTGNWKGNCGQNVNQSVFGESISAENDRVKLQVKTPVKQLKNSLAKKVLRPEGENYKQREQAQLTHSEGAQPRLGRAGDRERWPLAPSLEDWKVGYH